MTMDKYYWFSSYPLAPESEILPDNWYRIVSMAYGHHHSLLEEVYERIRTED